MKHFVFRIALFSLFALMLFTGIYLLSDQMINLRKKHFFKVNKNVNIVFAGDSNIACSVNDSLIPHSVNLASNGETYMYTYYKLKNLFEYNPQIKTVFLNYTYSNIDIASETYFLYSKEHLTDKNSSFNYLLGQNEKHLLFFHNPLGYILSLQLAVQKNITRICKTFTGSNQDIRDYNFGRYYFLDRHKVDEDIYHCFFREWTFTKSDIQLYYLKMISDLCKEHSVLLVLLKPPAHPFNKYFLVQEMKRSWTIIQKEQLKDSLLDFTTLPIPDSCYSDLAHLNYKGARIFSKQLNAVIESNKRVVKP